MRRIPTEQRRAELVAAAIRVISRDGVAAATTRAIVAEAGMPLGAFHYVFASRDELLGAVIDSVTSTERLTAELHAADAGSLEETVRSGLDAYIDLLEAEPANELTLLELAIVARRQSANGPMRAQWLAYYATAAALLTRAADLTGSEWTSPVDELARHLVTIVDGVTTTWLADQNTPAARRTAAFAAEAIARHARPRPTEAS
ncbi:MAG: TetR/AcrR family transcriptional regulator [Cellulomonadaceae bacterium]